MFLSSTVTLYFVCCLSLTDPIIKKVPLRATGTAQLEGYTEYLHKCQLFRLLVLSRLRTENIESFTEGPPPSLASV
jgi:hypothetical protein